MSEYGEHYPVFHQECIDCFLEIPNICEGYIADFTFGAGGHSSMLATKVKPLKVLGVDQDDQALDNARKTYSDLIESGSLELLKMNFIQFPQYWSENLSDKKLLGAVLDLGVSSHQFDTAERGFSFREDGPLDMRMNFSDESIPTAADILRDYDVDELEHIFRHYGEEKLSKRIAETIVEKRSLENLTTTKQLEEIVFHCYPKKWRYGRTHPATKVFQALRIEVNSELKVLEDVLPPLLENLEVGGRVFVISFHSLEDRIVKNVFRDISRARKGEFRLLTKRPLLPTEQELSENKRSRSAKLRMIERIGVDDGEEKGKKNYKSKKKFL